MSTQNETAKNVVVCLFMAAVVSVGLVIAMPSIKQAMRDSWQAEDQGYMETDLPPVGVGDNLAWQIRHWSNGQIMAAVVGALIIIGIIAYAIHHRADQIRYRKELEAHNSQLRLQNAALRGELPKGGPQA